MDFDKTKKMLEEMREKMETDKETNVYEILAAINRPKLEGLVKGDQIRQIQIGLTSRYKNPERQEIFVRYLTDAEKITYNAPREPGLPLQDNDIVTASWIDKSDGELMLYCVDSSFYQRA